MTTHYVVLHFDRDLDGKLVPGEAVEAPNAGAAQRRALELSFKHAGALTFRRTDGVGKREITSAYGAVDPGALRG